MTESSQPANSAISSEQSQQEISAIEKCSYMCPYKNCGFNGNWEWTVENHIRRMHTGMLRPLRITNMLLRDPQPGLRETPNERLRLYICNACSKTVRGRGQAIAHISVWCKKPNPALRLVSEEVYLLACCFCKKTFSSREELRTHEMFHLQ